MLKSFWQWLWPPEPPYNPYVEDDWRSYRDNRYILYLTVPWKDLKEMFKIDPDIKILMLRTEGRTKEGQRFSLHLDRESCDKIT